jgi:hypothetical protein
VSRKKIRLIAAAVVFGVSASTLTAAIPASAGASPKSAAPARATGATGTGTLPQVHAGRRAASWLASQVTASGDLVTPQHTPDISDTALTVLALAAAGGHRHVARRALSYMESHVHAYVRVDGHDGPGQLATLILDAHVLGVNPATFGGTDLVTRLLATMRTSGSDAGLFGVQSPTYDGAYRQGLSLAALAAAGVTQRSKVRPAIQWLQNQQCANGGWEAFRSSTSTPCTKTDPNTYTGPDTNSTALAIEGLAAQHATMKLSPLPFYSSLQAPKGGWGYYGGAADPDSTALVIQALLALHRSVSSPRFRKGNKDPVTALVGFQLHSGAFYYPTAGAPKTANALATEQALPALEKKAFPFR